MAEFLQTYWKDIVALVDKIYFAIKKFILDNENK